MHAYRWSHVHTITSPNEVRDHRDRKANFILSFPSSLTWHSLVHPSLSVPAAPGRSVPAPRTAVRTARLTSRRRLERVVDCFQSTLPTYYSLLSRIRISIYYTRTVRLMVIMRRAPLLAAGLCHLFQSPRTSDRVTKRRRQTVVATRGTLRPVFFSSFNPPRLLYVQRPAWSPLSRVNQPHDPDGPRSRRLLRNGGARRLATARHRPHTPEPACCMTSRRPRKIGRDARANPVPISRVPAIF